MNIVNKTLYKKVKEEADQKFQAKTGIYKSAWIVREYKKRGGKYKGQKDETKGLLRWFKEKWVDISRKDLPACGRPSSTTGKYPLCRPLYRITDDTPKTLSEIKKKLSEKEIKKIIALKRLLKWNKNVKF